MNVKPVLSCTRAFAKHKKKKSSLLTNSSMSAGLLGRGLVAPFDFDAVLALDGECFLDDDLLWDLGLKNDFIFFLGLTVASETYGNATWSSSELLRLKKKKNDVYIYNKQKAYSYALYLSVPHLQTHRPLTHPPLHPLRPARPRCLRCSFCLTHAPMREED